jgi:hypothetical protein
MLSNTFIVSEFVDFFYSFPTWSYVKMCHGTTTSASHLAICYTVPLRVYFTWQCAMRYHDQCNLAMCHAVPQPMYFTWQCLIRYQNQCLSPGNVACGTTTSATWKCVIRYHNQCISPGNGLCGTTTSNFYLAMSCDTTTSAT